MKFKKLAEGFYTIKIDLHDLYVNELEEGELVLTFREPTDDEFNVLAKIPKDDNNQRLDYLSKLWPECLIDWTVEDEKGKVKKEDVIKHLKKLSSAVIFISNEWGNKLPLARMSAQRAGGSDKSQDSTSEEKA